MNLSRVSSQNEGIPQAFAKRGMQKLSAEQKVPFVQENGQLIYG